ncbi:MULTISPECIES: aminopeptidase P N-terminal domain-containing protein [Methylotenera]|uniref:aminopeptidase P N-terminal domain-containing protein n=1 Tax=Methylotenera TaxID=359407 RepID=UPI00035C6B2A|nr:MULTISPECIES: aminopeptidase P N-terminal domain-containing protein [Methylotenera]
MVNLKEFQQRRALLLKQMGDGIAIIPTAAEATRNRDSHYPYRFDSYFYYLTGFTEPQSVLILIAGNAAKAEPPISILFCRDKDIEREIWDGFRYGPEAAQTQFGFDEAHTIQQLDALMPDLISNQSQLFYSLGTDNHWDARVTNWLNIVKNKARMGISAPQSISDVRQLIDVQRLIKTPFEIDLMRRSADIAASAHNRAMSFVADNSAKSSLMEYAVEAEFLHEFYRYGAQSPAYTSIVAGGANACTLHYNANNAALKNGDLLLIDAGCELDGYASDITRTFPVNGKFSAPQRDLYELVLNAQLAAIAVAKPGNHWNAPHEAALNVLVQGFIDFKLCKGSVEEVLENGSYRQFYMHRTGHWLGLDVHDAGEYKDKNGDWAILEAGNTLTVEPGCYVRPAENVPEHFWNIGIRIEDDVLITPTGNEVLTHKAIKTVADIELLMQR